MVTVGRANQLRHRTCLLLGEFCMRLIGFEDGGVVGDKQELVALRSSGNNEFKSKDIDSRK